MFLDASLFLSLFLGAERADEAEDLLGRIESGRPKCVTTLHVLEEVAFKLLIAKASSLLDEKNVWRIRDALKKDRKIRDQCASLLSEFNTYVTALQRGGLAVLAAEMTDFHNLPSTVKEAGLLTADCLHLAVMGRLRINSIATFDSDFRGVKGIVVVP